ncbi:MAG: hypothetical protein JWN66_342 [Sphingomonas bacterium]|jgi:hypothetical protein|uniref:hypothetical protein n=1 Tax=Sphingomonas bacterium TaxID=1895847 RepID=UPI0026395AC1|nr:hypothetical protein [Sphingomonas bacterium]MDB5703226.1 hypothetical protein [Sphingomonas bacterium]
MNRIGAILYGVAIGGIALLFARGSFVSGIWLFEKHAARDAALGVTGWLIATFGPVTLSVGVLLVARRLKARWLAHLIFLPAAIVICREGGYLFFYGAGVSGEGSPEDFALLLAAMFLLLTLVVHTAALVAEGYKKVAHVANGS